MRRYRTFVAAIAAALLAFTAIPGVVRAAEEDGTLVAGIVAGSRPDAVVLQWYPVVNYLSEQLGRPFKLVVQESHEDMLEDYRNGRLDIVLSGPLAYLKTESQAGAIPLASPIRPEGDRYHGAIITRPGIEAKGLEDLKGRSFAFTEPYSTTGYLLPRLAMAKAGIIQPADFFSEAIFAGHHADALDSVLTGHMDAAAVVSYLVDEANRKRPGSVNVIAETPILPPEIVFARPGLDKATASEIKTALLHMNERVDPELLQKLGILYYVSADAADYDEIRRDIELLKGLPPIPYTVDYGLVPAALANAADIEEASGLRAIFAVPLFALLLLVISAAALWRRIARDLRVRLAFFVAGLMIIVSFLISAQSAASFEKNIGNISLQWQRNINIFTAQAAKAVSEGNPALLQPLAEGLAAQRGILYVKAFRNSVFIADSEGSDTGRSIVPAALENRFRPDLPGAIDATSYLMAKGRRYASIMVGLDGDLFTKARRSAFLGNVVSLVILLGVGIALSLYWSRLVMRPLVKLGEAISEIRSGRRPSIDFTSRKDQIGALVGSFDEMASELRRRDEMLGQKASELDDALERMAEIDERRIEMENAIESGQEEFAEACQKTLDAMDRGIEPIESTKENERLADLRERIAETEREVPMLSKIRSKSIIGDSPAFLKVIRDIIIRSHDSDPVLLHGESGSGKTGVAEAIHLLSTRGDREMVEYNCAELAAADPVIVLGKLFGYGRDSGLAGVRKEGQPGLLEECDGTTLFLDEIGLLPLQTQGTLLLPLEGRPFNPAAGKGGPRSSDVRIVFASNVNLEDEVRAGRFRHDLLRRIKARGCIDIPPLRERLSDVETLAYHFLDQWRREKGKPMKLGDEAIALIKRYDYRRYNVAELATAIKIAADNALFRNSDIVAPEFFGDELGDLHRHQAELKNESRLFDPEEAREVEVLRRNDFRMGPSEAELGYSQESKTLSNHLRGIAYKILFHAGWSVEAAAEVIVGDASPTTLNRLRKKIEFYLRNAEKLIKAGDERKLFNNLPQKYHGYVEDLLRRVGS